MKNLSLVMLLSACLLGSEPEPLTVGEAFNIQSRIMGEPREVMVHLPDGYQLGQTRYPVLYLTDGPEHISHTSGTIAFLAKNVHMPEMIVVGIANTKRTRDLSPTLIAKERSGGAESFLKFFTDELFAHIEKNYRTLPYRVLSGHSLGGLFVLNTLLTQPDVFNAYLAVSPSLWWDDQVMLKRATQFFAEHEKIHRTLYLSIGQEGEFMEAPFNRFVALLGKQDTEGFLWSSKRFSDEDHASVVLRAQYFGFKKIFEGWQPPQKMRDFDTIKAHYQALSKRMGYEVKAREAYLNALGYGHLRKNQIEEATRIFTWNIENYPLSANVYDSLGEAYEKSNKLKLAHKNYEKAWLLGKTYKNANTKFFKQNMDRVQAALNPEG